MCAANGEGGSMEFRLSEMKKKNSVSKKNLKKKKKKKKKQKKPFAAL